MRIAANHVEIAETHEDPRVGGIDLVERAAFVDTEIAFAEPLILDRSAPGEPRGLNRTLEIGRPNRCEGFTLEQRPHRPRLPSAALGERRIAPTGDSPRGVVGGFTVTHQPEFDDLVVHSEAV